MRLLQTGDPCPLCGRRITTTDPDALQRLTAAAEALGLPDLREEPDNKPLTLEELGELVADTVWMVPLGDDSEVPGCWLLLFDILLKKDVCLFLLPSGDEQEYKMSEYGRTWQAYRHQTQEESI